MTNELGRQLARLRHGDHLCLTHETAAEQLTAAATFLRDGLERGERCLFVGDEGNAEAVFGALAAAGVDVPRERGRAALQAVTSLDISRLVSGEFDPRAMADFLRRAETEAIAGGFPGLRVAGDMTWAMGLGVSPDRLIEFEVLLDQFLRGSRAAVICQYDRSRFDPAVIYEVLHTHPVAILGELVCPNPYYELPEMVLRKSQPEMTPEFRAKRVDWWIAQLKRASMAEQERERALEELKQSERRFAEAEQVAHIGSWERDLRTNEVTWSDELYRLFGLNADEVNLSYPQFLNLILPQDVDRARARVEEAIRDRCHFSVDYRITRTDGSVRVLHDRGGVILNEAGEPVRLVGTAQDVTERRMAEQALQEYAARLQTLSRRVLEVQEEERRHLARELHDEVGQLLTGLKLLLKPRADRPADEDKAKPEPARVIVDELLGRIRSLSFDLRPAALDQLGLLPALLALVERYTEQTGVQVHLKHQGVDRRFAPELETTAYRVVQEAMTNVARHAGVTEVTVRVWATADLLSAQIEDRGLGFDPEAALASPRSSGLAGMQERVMLLAGSLAVESRPGAGTQITAELPLAESGKNDDPFHRPGR